MKSSWPARRLARRTVASTIGREGRGGKGHAVAQLERERLVVGRPLVRGGEHRHDVQLLVQVEQLVAQCRKHDAADESACHRRVKNVRVFREADSEGLTLYRRNKKEQ